MIKDIAIYGAGGLGREIACLIRNINAVKYQWNMIGFFDDSIPITHKTEYGYILGGINELNNYNKELAIVIAIGNPQILNKIYTNIINKKIEFPNIIAPDVILYDKDNYKIGFGNIIGFRCLISCNIKIGNFNILNTDTFIGHDTIIGNFNIINPSVRISGEVSIGNGNFFGVGCIILQQKKIGNNTVIGSNSVIIHKTKDNTTYIGNPATEFKY